MQYYSVLQSTTPVLLRTTNVLPQYYKVLLCTTKYYSDRNDVRTTSIQYYSVLQSTTPVLLRTTKYYSSTTPYYKVLLCTTKYYSDREDVRTTSIQYYSVLQSTTLYYKVLLQYYSVLQSTTRYYKRTTKYYSSTSPYYKVLLLQSSTKASKTSISCESSATFQGTSFQNEHFVRGCLNNKLPKRAFRARLPQLFTRTSFQNKHFVRGFLNFSSNKLPKRAFRARLPQLFKEQASKPSISCETSATFQATSFQNEHFVRGFLNFSIKELPKSCACHAKRENDLSP